MPQVLDGLLQQVGWRSSIVATLEGLFLTNTRMNYLSCHMTRLINLQTLLLNNCFFDCWPPELAKLPSLMRLTISNNDAHLHVSPSDIGRCAKLEFFCLTISKGYFGTLDWTWGVPLTYCFSRLELHAPF